MWGEKGGGSDGVVVGEMRKVRWGKKGESGGGERWE